MFLDSVPGMLDPAWDPYIETDAGLRSRYARVGCVHGDVTGIRQSRWIDDHESVLVLSDGPTTRIRLDAHGRWASDPDLTVGCAD